MKRKLDQDSQLDRPKSIQPIQPLLEEKLCPIVPKECLKEIENQLKQLRPFVRTQKGDYLLSDDGSLHFTEDTRNLPVSYRSYQLGDDGYGMVEYYLQGNILSRLSAIKKGRVITQYPPHFQDFKGPLNWNEATQLLIYASHNSRQVYAWSIQKNQVEHVFYEKEKVEVVCICTLEPAKVVILFHDAYGDTLVDIWCLDTKTRLCQIVPGERPTHLRQVHTVEYGIVLGIVDNNDRMNFYHPETGVFIARRVIRVDKSTDFWVPKGHVVGPSCPLALDGEFPTSPIKVTWFDQLQSFGDKHVIIMRTNHNWSNQCTVEGELTDLETGQVQLLKAEDRSAWRYAVGYAYIASGSF